jgi:kumamolisin
MVPRSYHPTGNSNVKAKKPKKKAAERDVLVAGSDKAAPSGDAMDTRNPNESMSVTVQIRRKKSLDRALESGERLSAADYEKNYGARASDLAAVAKFARLHQLSVVESSASRRSVILRGTVKNFEDAFHVSLANYRNADGSVFRGRSGGIKIPASLGKIIESVIGLDDRPQATPKS